MFDNEDEQDDFFSEGDSDFGQQDDYDSADLFNSSDTFTEENSVVVPRDSNVKLGYKMVGIVIAIILTILAIIILSLSRIHIVKKNNQGSTQSQIEQITPDVKQSSIENPVQEQVQSTVRPTEAPVVSTESASLVVIPDDTSIDYSGQVIQSQGVVRKLLRFLQGNQVIYCINLDISVGSTLASVNYYCGYNIYSQVRVGDILTIDYQQVSGTCFSVCTISK